MLRIDLRNKCDDLIDLYNQMKGDASAFDSMRILLAAACMYLSVGAEYHPMEVAHCRNIMKRRFGIFSKFRENESFIVACKMSMAHEPEEYLLRISDISDQFKTGVLDVNRTVLAAMILDDNSIDRGIDYLVAKTKRIYRRMKNTHRMLTGGEDLPLAALMAVSENDGQTTYERAEEAYEVFRRDLKADKNTIQLLSQIVSLYYGNIEEMCEKLIDIADILYRQKHKLGTGVRLGILGPLADTPYSAYEIAEDIIDADDYLSNFKPFRGIFGITGEDRRVFATICVLCAGIDAESAQRSAMVTTSVQLTIIFQITMMMVAASM